MSNCGRFLSCLKIKMPRTRRTSLRTLKTQLSEGSEAKVKFLIVGLCNHDMPTTRHSIGQKAIDRLGSQLGVTWTRQRKLDGFLSEPVIRSDMEILLLKSKLPMNLNGRSVRKAVTHFDIPPANVYLIHDELDKVPGKFTMKNGGSARGHNGVRSVADCLRSDVMPRLMIGIGRPADKSDVADYVLEDFTTDQETLVDSIMSEALKKIMSHMDTRCKEIVDGRAKAEENPALEESSGDHS